MQDEPQQAILDLFQRINTIPRCSGNERAISDWLVQWATDHGLKADRDEVLNVCIRVPGTAGPETASTVVLQGHMDMVCEKHPDSNHDFESDPIKATLDGDWLKANGTTLGADNGIAIAIALALVESEVAHPPLEILVTVDEETGLTGAQNLVTGWLEGRQLINIDSEDEGVFTVGCAGGRTAESRLPLTRADAPAGWQALKVAISGLAGGHSGVDIHFGRANANVVLARVLRELEGVTDYRLAEVVGGRAHNAIPRDAHAVILIPSEITGSVAARVQEFGQAMRYECRVSDPSVAVVAEPVTSHPQPMDQPSTRLAVRLLAAIPHGVIRMSDQVDDLVETSTNLAKVVSQDDHLLVVNSQRSSSDTRLAAIAQTVDAVSELAGASVLVTSEHPAWEPDLENGLLTRAVDVYQKRFGRKPVIEAIHAGLECGVIGASYPDMEMLSIGPTIKNPHSPDEALHVVTLDAIWHLLCDVLESYTGS